MTSTVEWIRKEVAGIVARGVGRVSTSVLDGVRVALSDEQQSQKKEARLNEIATVGIRDGNCLIVTLHDDNVSLFLIVVTYKNDAKQLSEVLQTRRKGYLRSQNPKRRASKS